MASTRSLPRRSARRLAVAVALAALLPGAGRAAVEAPRPRNVRFERIAPEDGLSQAFVTCSLQDRHGFMWFGTQEGLNRYDGLEFKIYTHDPRDPTSLARDSVRSIVEDATGVLWVGTLEGGLSRFDTVRGTFEHYRHDPGDPASLSGDRVEVVYQDRQRRLWVGSDTGGLDLFNRRRGDFTHVELLGERSLGVTSITQDSDGILWIGSRRSGLFAYDPLSSALLHYRHDPDDPGSLSDDRILALLEDRGGRLWVATDGGGLNRLDRATGSFDRFRHAPTDPGSIASDTVRAVFEDRYGTLWVGTDAGLDEWHPESRSFAHYAHDPDRPYTLSHDSVISIGEDRGGVLWVGTYAGLNKWNRATEAFLHYQQSTRADGQLADNFVTAFAPAPGGKTFVGTVAGLSLLDPSTGEFANFRSRKSDPETLSDDRVMALHTDRSGALWIGGRRGGLDRLDPLTGRVTRFGVAPHDPDGLSGPGVTSILEDSSGRLWVGTFRSGLNLLDRTGNSFRHYRHDPDDPASLSTDRVLALHEDRRGRLWIGTNGGGLNLLDPETGRFTAFRAGDGDSDTLLNDVVWAIAEDRGENLWLGTRGGGLSVWQAEDRQAGRARFRSYTDRQGLLNNVIYSVLVDDAQQIWVGSSRGLARFDPRREEFTHYNEGHGLQGNEFNFGAAYRSPGGELYFGGINGFNVFRPDRLELGAYRAPVALTRARIGNRTASGVTGADVEAFRIEHRDRFVELEFAALDYAAPSQHKYRYRVDGLEDDWIDLGHRRRIGYANLAPGGYTVEIEASSYDGSWNDDRLTVRLDVLPAPWAGPLAQSGYVLATGLALLMTNLAYRRRLERVRELAAANKAKELAEYASRTKSQFLANMSHEIRTPLNGVLGMVELLQRTELSGSQSRFASTAGRSARHLLNLLNDLLDLSKIEAGKLQLESVGFDLRQLVEEVVELFAESAQQKGLQALCSIPESTPTRVVGDPTRLRQVLGNLIGNAIKFTSEGHVLVRVSSPGGSGTAELRFSVEDTGIGMEPAIQKRIFESFRQADGSTTRKYGGTGLGLSISKQLVERMGGEIEVSSHPGRGSTFRFAIAFELEGSGRASGAAPSFPGTRALVAHGHPTAARVLAERLADWGVTADLVSRLDEPGDMRADFALVDATLVETGGTDAWTTIAAVAASARTALLTPVHFQQESEALRHGVERCIVQPARRADLVRFLADDDASRFVVDSEGSEERGSPPPGEPSRVPRILVAEDDPTNQAVVGAVLESLGVESEIVGDGLRAVEEACRADWDLILMDCQMPEMDGYDASRAIREHEQRAALDPTSTAIARSVPIIATTASAMTGERARCSAAGMDDYLGKPFNTEELALTLERHLRTGWRRPSTGKRRDAAITSTPAAVKLEAPDDDERIDTRRLEIIRSLAGKGGDELLRTVVEGFTGDAPAMLAEMRSALEAGDLASIQHNAHRMKSASANLGAIEVSRLAAELETKTRNGASDGVEALISEIEIAFAQARRILEETCHQAA